MTVIEAPNGNGAGAPHAAEAIAAQSTIFDIPIDLGGPRSCFDASRPGSDRARPARRVMYVNAHVLNQTLEDPALRATLEAADLVYCDGYGVRLAAKALDTEIPHRMTGADWIWGLAALCETEAKSVYLLGRSPSVARTAADACSAGTPACEIAGTHHGFFELGSAHDDRVVEDINARAPTSSSSAWARRSRSCGSSATPIASTRTSCGLSAPSSTT